MSAVSLRHVLEEYDLRLAAFEGGLLTVQDMTGDVGRTNNPRAHGSVRVTCDATRNRNGYRDQALARVDDTITVTILFRLNAASQRDSERDAIDTAERVRAWLTDGVWLRALHPTFIDEARSPAAEEKGLYRIVQRHRVTRDAQLGG